MATAAARPIAQILFDIRFNFKVSTSSYRRSKTGIVGFVVHFLKDRASKATILIAYDRRGNKVKAALSNPLETKSRERGITIMLVLHGCLLIKRPFP
jgi:hypothetical protein